MKAWVTVKHYLGVLVVGGLLLCAVCACTAVPPGGEGEVPSSATTTNVDQSVDDSSEEITQSTTDREGNLSFDELESDNEPPHNHTTTASQQVGNGTTSTTTTQSKMPVGNTTTTTTQNKTSVGNNVSTSTTDKNSSTNKATTSTTTTTSRTTSASTVAPPIDNEGYGPIVKP